MVIPTNIVKKTRGFPVVISLIAKIEWLNKQCSYLVGKAGYWGFWMHIYITLM